MICFIKSPGVPMIKEARIDGRKRRAMMTREIAYQKVLLAVYIHSEDDGYTFSAYNTFISRECGVSPESVGRAMVEMERRGVIRSFDWRDGLCCRVCFLLDHPKGKAAARRMRRECGPRRKRGD